MDEYRYQLSNNYERAVFLKHDPVYPREATRYIWANHNLLGKRILEVGCSTGYGVQFLPNDITYLGLDYDPTIVQVANDQQWLPSAKFACANIITDDLRDYYDTIIAFEVIEHMDEGLEVLEKLKRHCQRLLFTVPHDEPKGFWGEHHKLHGLTEKDFPGCQFFYINEHGQFSDRLQYISDRNRCNLMLGIYNA